ncbi:anti-phage ZorAB system protein ZorA [Variovorax robiniae]|uniref:Anti-phage ZorAB system protein ZorA n=1 Tax=Variovorax robiniae TaxID=1836199 RepID=A0ABU8XG93_9BURK
MSSLLSPDVQATLSLALHVAIASLLCVAFLSFVLFFVMPGLRTGRELKLAHRKLAALKRAGVVLDLDQVREEAMNSATLRHCWDEYRDTLHGQKTPSATGILEIARWRATATANAFFTEQALVDAPLRTEFYKHLPGILTGLGIIATFAGLIVGLMGFKVQGDAAEVQRSLGTLIGSVGGAFIYSGAAICLAMVVTTIEKLVINSRYTQVERLCGLIDSLFDAGAGEEYLQRLVEASETSATQAMQMKESLVTDLKQVLTELTQQQIASMTANSAKLGETLSGTLKEGLAGPLDRISEAVQSFGTSTGQGVNDLLTNVLTNFTERMEGMFGGQLKGMSEMLGQTAATIKDASTRFETLANQIQSAGTGAAEAMGKRMDEALQQMQVRQAESNQQMQAFIEQMKQKVAQGQADTAAQTMKMMKDLGDATAKLVQNLEGNAHQAQQDHLARLGDTQNEMRALMERLGNNMAKTQGDSTQATSAMLKDLGDSTAALVANMQARAAEADSAQRERQAALASQAGTLLDRQDQHATRLSQTVSAAVDAMRQCVERLQTATNANVERMGTGAERLLGASNRLGDNLEATRAATDGLGNVADKLQLAGSTLNTALDSTRQSLGEQKAVRDALATMVSDLRSTVENARREASLTSTLVGNLDAASQKLGQAQQAADVYLQGVTQVLGEAHAAFASNVESTLSKSNTTFHQELAKATNLLRDAIQELGDTLEALPTA